MNRFLVTLAASFAITVLLWSAPSVFPTGTTSYDPAAAWNGYTVLSPLGTQAAIVIDMNGNEVKRWEGYVNSAGGPARVLPGGIAVAAAGTNPPRQESTELVQRDFDGKEMWRFDRNEQIVRSAANEKGKTKGKGAPKADPTKGGETIWSTRQHHDWQRDDFPAGYYSPQYTPSARGAKTLLLTHTNRTQAKVSASAMLEDDRIIEIDWDGKLLWEWVASDHIDEFKFDKISRDAIASASAFNAQRGSFDWLHLNSATYVGPNKWFDAGDRRFAPENVIVSSREASLVAIIARNGSIVWQIGPDFRATPEQQAIQQIIGQHHAHFIPQGLPGAGNMMIFDNGGASGYGPATATAPKGKGVYVRPTSRVLEIDPVTLKLVWSYTASTFFATNISGAQRLVNGNTLITEGPSGRIFEVTTAGRIVWEYIYPPTGAAAASVYRAYRLPYEWIPQLQRPTQRAVTPPAAGQFRVP